MSVLGTMLSQAERLVFLLQDAQPPLASGFHLTLQLKVKPTTAPGQTARGPGALCRKVSDIFSCPPQDP